jgi:hypothetical protein
MKRSRKPRASAPFSRSLQGQLAELVGRLTKIPMRDVRLGSEGELAGETPQRPF